MLKFFRKYHRWAGLILVLFMVLFSITGIIMNHRSFFSGVSVDRQLIPDKYSFSDWNLAAVRSTEQIGTDSILMYGNIGIWLTDSTFSHYSDFNQGFKKGIDNRKVYKVLKLEKGLYAAGTLFGLFVYRDSLGQWEKVQLPHPDEQAVDLMLQHDSLYVLTRSHLYSSGDLQHFSEITLPAPAGYDNKVGLFKTLWEIHSGEIFGIPGKLVVDFAGVVLIFMSISGFVMFVSRKSIKKRQLDESSKKAHKKRYKKHFHLHHKIGWVVGILLFISAGTGIFLRPPLLIAIAAERVGKIPFTKLDTPNPWYDQLRRIIYIEADDRFIVSTTKGFYYSDTHFSDLIEFKDQAPASVMGVNVMKVVGPHTLWIGSFEGLFEWNYATGEVWDVIEDKAWVRPDQPRHPVGNYKIAGHSDHFGEQALIFDYDRGTKLDFNKTNFPDMPDEIRENTPMSLWNVSQEIHTGRIYSPLLGDFYILVVPLSGIMTLLMLVSGMWMRYRRIKKNKK